MRTLIFGSPCGIKQLQTPQSPTLHCMRADVRAGPTVCVRLELAAGPPSWGWSVGSPTPARMSSARPEVQGHYDTNGHVKRSLLASRARGTAGPSERMVEGEEDDWGLQWRGLVVVGYYVGYTKRKEKDGAHTHWNNQFFPVGALQNFLVKAVASEELFVCFPKRQGNASAVSAISLAVSSFV